MDVKVKRIYECGKCHRTYSMDWVAERCCTSGTCRVCGQTTEYWWLNICKECHRKESWSSKENTFIRASDYDSPVHYKERFFGSVDELLKETGGKFPSSGVFGTQLYPLEIGSSDFDKWEEEHTEYFGAPESAAEDEWLDFLKRFNDKWAPCLPEKDPYVSICRDDDPRAQ